MSRFLVLGASGMAGHTISIYLAEQGHDVVGFSRRPVAFIESINGDAFDDRLLRDIILRGDFDVVVNAIGILTNDADANADKAVYLNAFLPHRLAAMTRELKTRIIHLSTDCVFAGNTGPYTENSFRDGGTIYDRTKALGELCDAKNLTLRNSIVGPDMKPDGIGLFNWFMTQSESMDGFTKAMWSGLTTVELAKAIDFVSGDGSAGLVNMVPKGSISKFDLLNLFRDRFRSGRVEIHASEKLSLDKTLIRTNFASAFMPAPYGRQIEELAQWMSSHMDLYPHYGLD